MPRTFRPTLPIVALAALAALPALSAHAVAQTSPSIAQFMSPASPLELVAAKRAERVAWTTYEQCQRNVHTAAAPGWKPVRITSFLEDDGQDVNSVALSDDGRIAVFVRGHAPNRDGWVANPTHDPRGSERAIWAAATDGSGAWRLAEGGAPVLSPDGSTVVYVKGGQIYRARVEKGGARDSLDRGLVPLVRAWGQQASLRWSPDGSKLAFVSLRGDHSFIGLYDVRARTVRYVSPGVDCDAAPAWSPDGKRIVFVRRPGTPFGAQVAAAAGRSMPCGASAPGVDSARVAAWPGLHAARFEDGGTLRIMVADVASVDDIDSPAARVLWSNAAAPARFTAIPQLLWGAGHLVFGWSPPDDEWDRYWALSLDSPAAEPVQLTTTDGLIESASSVALSADGHTLYYTTNAQDIERRHIWAVPVAGGQPRQLSTGADIETHPQPLASGRELAVLHFGARHPAGVALLPAKGGAARRIYPQLGTDFPLAAHVVPEIVWTTAEDGVRSSNQLFLPPDLRPGERRPAIVFVHGGPRRQMLPGYHYMQFYHWAYAYNQWLANQGYIVLSVNYRRGVGYGRSFRDAPDVQARGNAEYRDVIAAGRYLQTRADVDPARVGIWGLSYGGLLVAQALARNSDVFVAGIDLAGVHLYGSVADTALAFRSAAASEVANWKSPVLLVHGDDDRNVGFSQTVGLVQQLRAHGVYHELIVVPDDVHESMLHRRWLYTWDRMGDFLHRFVRDRAQPPD